MLSGRVLARFSSLKTYLQVRIDLKYGFSPPHVSYQPGTASTVNKERRWELRVWTEHQSTVFLVCSPRPRTHRALLLARDNREMSAPNSKAKDPTGGTEGGHPPPRPRGQGPHLRGTCTHMGTVLSSSRMPCPFHCWAECSSSVQTPTICGPG